MMPQPHRLALDLEIPPVLHGPASYVAIRGEGLLAIVHVAGAHEIAGGPQLHDQPFEGLADPPQRRDALFVQLPGNAIVRF